MRTYLTSFIPSLSLAIVLASCTSNSVPRIQLEEVIDDPACPTGGTRILIGEDTDHNETLFGQEVTDSHVLCNSVGTPGLPGPQGPSGEAGPAGPPGMMSGFDAVVATTGGTHPTIQAAVDDGAQRIFVRRGTYTLTEDLSLPANTVLQGEGPTTTVIEGSYTVHLESHTTLRDLGFRNQGRPMIEGESQNTFERLHVNSTTSFGILAGEGTTIKDCRFDGTSDAIRVGPKSWITRNALMGTPHIFISAGAQSTVTENQIQVTSGGTSRGIETDQFSEIRGNRIFGNSTGTAIRAETGSRITGNDVEGFGSGVVLDGDIGGGVVQSNVIRETSNAGIIVSSPSNPGHGHAIVSGNVVIMSGGNAYRLQGFRMVVRGNSAYESGRHCYEVESFHDAIFADNQARHCGQDGFHFFRSGTGVAVTGNNAVECQGHGFTLDAFESTFTGNIARRNGGSGFVWENNWRSVMLGNLALNNDGGNHTGRIVDDGIHDHNL